jgi:TolA-binding protein
MALRSTAAALLDKNVSSASVVETIALGHAAAAEAAEPSAAAAALLHIADAVAVQARCSELELALQRQQQQASRLQQEAQELRADKGQLQQEAQQLKREQQLMQQLLEQQRQAASHSHTAAPATAAGVPAATAAAAAAAAEDWDELADPLLAASSQREVSTEAARGFILRLQAARQGCRQMRRAFCSMLKHLSTGLYSSSEHLMHELIQNAEDAHVQQAGADYAGGLACLGWCPCACVCCPHQCIASS